MAPRKSVTVQDSAAPRRSRRSSLAPGGAEAGDAPVYNAAAAARLTSYTRPAAAGDNKRKRATLNDQDSDDSEDDSYVGRKGQAGGASPAKRPARAAAGKTTSSKKRVGTKSAPKLLKPVKEGLNPLPTLFSPASQFTFAYKPLPTPADSPRTAFVFGEGGFGQHGLGTADNVLCEIKKPRLHAGFEQLIATDTACWGRGGVAEIECGGMHTLAIDPLGQVWSWGINDNAALGRVTSIPDTEAEELESVPMLVQGLQEEGFKAVRVDAGDSVSLALSNRGELRCWGSFRTSEGLLGFSGKQGASQHQLKPVALENLSSQVIVQLATGDDHFLALTSSGHVYACGNGEQNQLGRKIIARHKTHGLTPERLSLKNIVHVGSGSYHSFAVSATGTVYAWGLNSFHQTGVSHDDGGWQETLATPTVVAALDPALHGGAKVVKIAGGEHHSLFLFDNGEVWACGRCDGHEVGLSSEHPEMVAGQARKAAAVTLREARSSKVAAELLSVPATTTEDGTAVPAMDAATAALESQRIAAEEIPLPNPFIPVPTLLTFPASTDGTATHIIDLSAGTRHNLSVSATGELFAWGVGESAQLGLGEESEAEVPTKVMSVAMKGFRVIQARTGGQHSVILAVREEGAKENVFLAATAAIAAPAAKAEVIVADVSVEVAKVEVAVGADVVMQE